MLQVGAELAENLAGSLSKEVVAEALAAAGVKVAVLSALGGGIELDHVSYMLKQEFISGRAGSRISTGSSEIIH